MSIWEEIKSSFRHGTTLTRLIYINGAIFIIIKLAEVIGVLSGSPAIASAIISSLAVPASISALALKPWTPLTYMFTHQGFIHLLFNLLWLYWFGRIFLSYLDQRKLVAIYILGGLSGALLYITAFNLFPAFAGAVHASSAIGASASVMALVVGTAVYLPDLQLHLLIFGRVRLKYLALITFLITSLFDFSVNTGGKIAHIGGALIGLAYGQGLRNGKDIGAWLNRIIDFFVVLFRPGKKMRVKYRREGATQGTSGTGTIFDSGSRSTLFTGGKRGRSYTTGKRKGESFTTGTEGGYSSGRAKTDIEYNREKAERQKEIDHILDKISKGGYDSLTKEEKAILFSESQKKR